MRILFINQEYPPIPDPSGRLVCTMTEELKKQGHVVDVIVRDFEFHVSQNETGTIYWLKKDYWTRLSQRINDANCKRLDKLIYFFLTYLRKFALMFQIRHFPNVELKMTKKTVRLFRDELAQNKYDMIVGFFRPYSCLAATIEIAKKYSNAKCVACYFDLVEEKSCPKLMPLSLYNKLIRKGDEFVFSECDNVMLPCSAASTKNELYEKYAQKTVYYDFPTFIMNEDSGIQGLASKKEADDVVKFVFAGSLDKDYRNPQRMLEILNSIALKNKDLTLQLDIFGGGNCFELIDEYQKAKNFLVQNHGRVPKETVTKYESKADFLVNIMNAYASLVPSKIFGLFATGKPILNIMTKGDDCSLSYFEKYPAVYTADFEKEDVEHAEEIARFITKCRGYQANLSEIKLIYQSSTPEYVVNQMLQLCME